MTEIELIERRIFLKKQQVLLTEEEIVELEERRKEMLCAELAEKKRLFN